MQRFVASMIGDASLRALAETNGVDIVGTAWEDTARSAGSCVGPNITDVTLQLVPTGGLGGVRLPIIRTKNFADVTADVPIAAIKVRGPLLAPRRRAVVREGLVARAWLIGRGAAIEAVRCRPMLASEDAGVTRLHRRSSYAARDFRRCASATRCRAGTATRPR